MASVTLKNIKKVYPPIPGETRNSVAVQNFNLEIKDKEFIVLVGPSGCGKSTTLRMVAGLEDITEGDLYIGDVRVNDVEPKDRDIAMVFQNYALYPHMTVHDNMAFALKQRRVPKQEIEARVNEAAQILGITDYLNRKPKNLSGGQRQRVAIGRAIVRNPKVFLMDEPLSNLDAKLRNQMRAELIKLRQKIDATFIYVTHDQTEAVTLGDRVVIMKDGFIQQVGTPYEVFHHPANVFVAGFIGTPQMNFFDAELKKQDGKWTVALEGASFLLPEIKQDKLNSSGAEEGQIILGVRPEDIELCEKGDPGSVEGEIDVFEMMGSSVHLHMKACGKEIIIITKRSDEQDRLIMDYKPGQKMYFRLVPSSVHLFGKENQMNLEK